MVTLLYYTNLAIFDQKLITRIYIMNFDIEYLIDYNLQLFWVYCFLGSYRIQIKTAIKTILQQITWKWCFKIWTKFMLFVFISLFFLTKLKYKSLNLKLTEWYHFIHIADYLIILIIGGSKGCSWYTAERPDECQKIDDSIDINTRSLKLQRYHF